MRLPPSSLWLSLALAVVSKLCPVEAGQDRDLFVLIQQACRGASNSREALPRAREAAANASFDDYRALCKQMQNWDWGRGVTIARQVAWQLCADFFRNRRVLADNFPAVLGWIADKRTRASGRLALVGTLVTHPDGFHDTSHLTRGQCVELAAALRGHLADPSEDEWVRREAALCLAILSRNQLVLALRKDPRAALALRNRVPMVDILKAASAKLKDDLVPFLTSIREDIVALSEVHRRGETSSDLRKYLAKVLRKYPGLIAPGDDQMDRLLPIGNEDPGVDSRKQ